MLVLAIDPGTTQSAMVLWDGRQVVNSWYDSNNLLLHLLDGWPPNTILVVEKVESYGMAVGEDVFETVHWGGVFCHAFGMNASDRMGRKAVKMHLCQSMRAKDANIRQALIDRFGKPGSKKAPGTLYGISGHLWAALALAVTYYDVTHVNQGVVT